MPYYFNLTIYCTEPDKIISEIKEKINPSLLWVETNGQIPWNKLPPNVHLQDPYLIEVEGICDKKPDFETLLEKLNSAVATYKLCKELNLV